MNSSPLKEISAAELTAPRCATCGRTDVRVRADRATLFTHKANGAGCRGSRQPFTTLGAQRRAVGEDLSFSRAVCARPGCGVVLYHNRGEIIDGPDQTLVAVCLHCPTGVNFATAYPVGTRVRVTDGFAYGIEADVLRVSDAYPGFPAPEYAGRSYRLDLGPVYGERPMTEKVIAAVDPADEARYRVERSG
ncbi:hypothetical protein AB0M43_36165 [Longispora sp. NPDC051575]|uniref:hypothetical protein n=1 Tax=Longispora sp. NPDC051575 TaxID=3154943 RepID=UPI00344810DD